MNKSVINSYRLQPGPVQSPLPGVIAWRIIPAVTSANIAAPWWSWLSSCCPLLAVGVVIYAAQATRPAPVAVQAVPSVSVATPVVVVQERVVGRTAPLRRGHRHSDASACQVERPPRASRPALCPLSLSPRLSRRPARAFNRLLPPYRLLSAGPCPRAGVTALSRP